MLKTIPVKTPTTSYEIKIHRDWIDRSSLERFIGGRKYLIVTDDIVYGHYQALLNGMACVILPNGEETKSFSNYQKLLDTLQEYQFNRSSVVIAFGGGVIGDLVGFVAATYMRGIAFIQIPTTLLAMVDSSVGGKVAINHPNAKNLVGAFYQPEAVYVDLAFLRTLDKKVLSDGMAEVIKYGLGFDKMLFETLEDFAVNTLLKIENNKSLVEIIARCCEIKAEIVGADERDVAGRQLLNLGHTLGHAVEQYYKYAKYRHGAAIAIGMNLKAIVAVKQGRLTESDYFRLRKLLAYYELPYNIEETGHWDEILEAVHLDKKNTIDSVQWIRVDAIGACSLEKIDFELLSRHVLEAVKYENGMV